MYSSYLDNCSVIAIGNHKALWAIATGVVRCNHVAFKRFPLHCSFIQLFSVSHAFLLEAQRHEDTEKGEKVQKERERAKWRNTSSPPSEWLDGDFRFYFGHFDISHSLRVRRSLPPFSRRHCLSSELLPLISCRVDWLRRQNCHYSAIKLSLVVASLHRELFLFILRLSFNDDPVNETIVERRASHERRLLPLSRAMLLYFSCFDGKNFMILWNNAQDCT